MAFFLKPIQIYTEKISPRLEYACYIIFDVVLQSGFKLHESLPMASDINEPFIYYGSKQLNNAPSSICITPFESFLYDQGVNEIKKPAIKWENDIPLLFINENNDLGFDIFSSVFFMASRYEEYMDFEPDNFGRFPAAKSFSETNGFTHLPVIHIWVEKLRKLILVKNPTVCFEQKPPKAIFTYDIDVAYAYKGRPFLIHFFSFIKDLVRGEFSNINLKFQHRFGQKSDPSDTYNLLENNYLDTIPFFLVSEKRTRFDRNISPKHPVLQKLILRLQSKHGKIGLHPSYYSSENPSILFAEKAILETIIQKPVTCSRQHYLKFRLPHTFRNLIKSGIEHDYSMQYPEKPGFRAGICLPFAWYDVERDRKTRLILHPGCIMETTFRDDLHLSAIDSLSHYESLWKTVKDVNGHFIAIWHNDTLWEGLKEDHPLAFRQIHEVMAKKIHEELMQNPTR